MDILTDKGDGTTALTLVLGDSADLVLTVDDGADVPAIVDLSETVTGDPGFPAIIRMAIKDAPAAETNDSALTYRTSFDTNQVEVLAQAGITLGQFIVHLDKPDSEAADPATAYWWDVEVSRQGALRTAAGTVSLPAGGGAVVGSGTAFTAARAGDILQPDSGPNAGKPCLILAIVDATHLVLENPGLAADAAATFTIRRGIHRTVIRGGCTFTQGVVTT